MSQSRFSIVLVGVSALLRRPLVSRLRPAAFTARCSGGFCRSALPSVSEIAAWRVDASARRVGLRVRSFRFSARAASGLPLGGLAFGLTTSAFRHAPLRGCPRRVGSSAFRFGNCPRRVGLRAHRFRFSARTDSEWLLGEFVLPPSASEIALGGLAFGLTVSASRHAPLRGYPRRVGLRAHGFRFSACAASEIAARWVGLRAHDFRFRHAPLRSCRWASWFCRLPFRRLPLGELAFGLTASAFRHAPLRSCPRRVGSSAFRFGDCRSAGWASGSRFGVALGELAFGLTASAFRHAPFRRLPLGGLPFGLTTSAFRHAPLRSCRSASWFFCLPFRRLPLGGLAFGLTTSAFRHAPIRTAVPPT